MSAISIIILVVLLLSVTISFWALFKGKRATNIVVVPSYNSSVEEILNERCKNDGERLTQEQLLENTDYVLEKLFD
ncbi:MAG: hypothetical protein LBG80_06355 [Bacteroidales bacterium]|jgi:hypothetical protein|nr:hypothetical protein [Bacteroidales bacterium]